MAQVPFPAGVPTAWGRAGLYVDRPGKLPVMLLFRDWDILWLRGGRASFQIGSAAAFVAATDDFVILPPCTPIHVSHVRDPLSWQFCHFVFRPPPDLPPTSARHADYAGPGRHARLPLCFSAEIAPAVKRAYTALARWDVPKRESPWRFERALLNLIAAVAEFAQKRSRGGASDRLLLPSTMMDARVESIRERIESDPTRAWRVQALAREAGVTPGHLHALCRRTLGMSLKRCIVETRLRHALRLLKETREGEPPAIWQVAEACGFSSQHFFARQFRQRFRLTPLSYRNGTAVQS